MDPGILRFSWGRRRNLSQGMGTDSADVWSRSFRMETESEYRGDGMCYDIFYRDVGSIRGIEAVIT